MKRALCVAALTLLPAVAFAQANPGPFGGLFGRTPERTGKEYTLFDVRTLVGAQYDDQVLDRNLPVGERMVSGQIYGARVGGLFARHSDRIDLRIRSMGTYNEYATSKVGATNVETDGSFSGKVGTRLSIDARVMHIYTPYFNFLSYPVYGPEVDGFVSVTSQPYATMVESNTLDGEVGFTSFYSKHSTIGASYLRRSTRFTQSPGNDFELNGFRARWTRSLSRSVGLHFEYERDSAQLSGAGNDVIYERIDLGLDLLKALSPARRTTVVLDAETAIIKQPEMDRSYRLNGGVTVSRWFNRTWTLAGHIHRLTDFLPGFREPLFSDTAGIRLGGMFSERTELSAFVNAGRGRFGMNPDSPPFDTRNAGVQFSFAIAKHFAVFASQNFDYYDVPPASSAVAPVRQFARNSFSVGLTTWIPIFLRERVPSDTR